MKEQTYKMEIFGLTRYGVEEVLDSLPDDKELVVWPEEINGPILYEIDTWIKEENFPWHIGGKSGGVTE